jgi:hypothetical protein
MSVLRISLTSLLYAVIGTAVAIVGYGLLRRLLGYASQRSLEAMFVFFDLVVYTGFAFAVAGIVAGIIGARAYAPPAAVAAAAVVAFALAFALAPNAIPKLPFVGGLSAGVLVAGGIAAALGLLRPAGDTGHGP